MSTSTLDYRDLYLAQARLQFERISAALHRIEQAQDRTAFETALRAAHTLKGMSAAMGYDIITQAAHSLEDLLESIRAQPFDLSRLICQAAYPALDQIAEYIDQVSVDPPISAMALEPQLVAGSPGAPAPSHRANFAIEQLDTIHYLAAALLATSRRMQAQGAAQSDKTRDAWATHAELIHALQELGWHLRMVPFGDIATQSAALLAELAHSQGKEIQIQVTGEAIEVEVAIAQELGPALAHLVRNAVTHGIETVQERHAAGKPERGVIRIRAGLDGDWLVVQVADDGRGLDAGQIRRAAIEQGFINATMSAQMSEAEAYKLLTLSGLTLAPHVTLNAGRGIGLDNVKTFVESVGGSISIQSEPGHSASFSLRVPQARRVIPVELVAVGPLVFALAVSQVESTARIAAPHLARLEESIALAPETGSRLYRLGALLNLSQNSPRVEYGLVTLKHTDLVMLVVDELLGRTMWFPPSDLKNPPVTLLDPTALFPR